MVFRGDVSQLMDVGNLVGSAQAHRAVFSAQPAGPITCLEGFELIAFGAGVQKNKIGDGASWITTSLICFLIVPILFYIEINIGIDIKLYITIVFPLLFIFSIILLRIIRYLLLKKYMN